MIVKVGDTRPLAATIRLHTTQTIPDGWEYYAENQIKKIAPVTPPNGNIKNSYGTSQTDTYSQEYINNLNTYSTDEIRIGTYLGKPLYRKVFELNNITSSTSNTNFISLASLNIKDPVHLYGYYYASGNKFSIPFTDSDANYSVMFVSGENNLRGRIVNSATSIYAKVVLEYTKTTD